MEQQVFDVFSTKILCMEFIAKTKIHGFEVSWYS
jgi:hypothetical protein